MRAADLADRCEAAGELVTAALLREVAQDVEEGILAASCPAGWRGLMPPGGCCPVRAVGSRTIAVSA